MKMMLSVLTFVVLVAGVFSTAGAASDAHGEGHGDGAHHSVGVPQPVADPSKATRPGRVTLAEPKAFAKLKAGTVNLTWKSAEGAESYHVQVATDPRFKWMVSEEFFVKGESFTTPDLKPGTYFWRVASKRPGNDPSWTTGFFTSSSFVVE